MASHSAQDFYDQLAEDYHLIYADWSLSVSRQGNALDSLVRRYLDGAEPLEVLDCSCGIGTQAIGLAEHGHRIVGSDLSPAAAVRAAAEVQRRGLAAATLAADMRSLPFADASFDVVLSADNSLAHLLTEDDVRHAVGDMRRVMRDSGLLVLSARDYGDARQRQRQSTVPQVTNSDAGQVVTFQLWHWHDDGVYDFDHVQLLPDGNTWQVLVRRATSRAWALEELTELVRECEFGNVTWHGVEETHFFQPVLTARPVG
ncbi:class I SAM-dependent methyltransferase [Streptomyces sp. Edi4]|uniref:class I SAM-dependent methyltransferase n=1 Tax=Streptomyces sp. Edi4 TaxID=3162527 RepID=UPI0033057D9B